MVRPGIFIGKAAKEFRTFEKFNKVFMHMQKQIESYLDNQEKVFEQTLVSGAMSLSFIGREFSGSIRNISTRLDKKDSKKIERNTGELFKLNACSIISLNYTSFVDRIMDAGEEHFPILHPHGSLVYPRQIIFGISKLDQVENEDFHTDFCEACWTKRGRDDLYGNLGTEAVFDNIGKANLIVTFGVSYRLTDSYLWEKIGDEMRKRKDLMILCFDHELPAYSGSTIFGESLSMPLPLIK